MGDPAPGKVEADRAGWIVRDHFPDGVAPVSKILFDGAGTGTGIGFGSSSMTAGIDMSSATISGDDIVLSATGVIMAATSVGIEIAGTSKLAVTATTMILTGSTSVTATTGTLTVQPAAAGNAVINLKADAGAHLTITQTNGAGVTFLSTSDGTAGFLFDGGLITLDKGATIDNTTSADVLAIEEATLTFTGATKINLDGPTDVTGILTIDTGGSPADGIKINATTPTDGLEIASACGTHAINISGAQSGAGITIANTCGTHGLHITGACTTSAVTIGASGTPAGDFVWYGTTALYAVTFDANGDTNGSVLVGADTKGIMFNLYGDVTGCGVFWDPSTDTNGTLSIGATGGSKGNDLIAYGNTNGNYLHWDQSGDDLLLVGTATQLSIAGTTDSSSVSTGSLNTAGGLGVAKKSFFGDDMSIATGKKITTVAELTLNSVDPLTIQIGGVDWLQMDEAAIASFAAATDTAGHAVYFETEDGGVDGGTASTGQAGGLYTFKTGDGSAAVTTGAVGGAGGALTLITGIGNTGETAGNGGAGGALDLTAGAGGSSGAGAGVGGTGGSITLTAGAGGGAGGGTAGAPGKVKIATGTLQHTNAQSIAMGDAAVTLTLVPGTPTGTLLTSNVIWVDAESTGTENLLLPPEADCNGLVLYIYNFGGETVNVQDDAGGGVDNILTTEVGVFFCNGTAWKGANIA